MQLALLLHCLIDLSTVTRDLGLPCCGVTLIARPALVAVRLTQVWCPGVPQGSASSGPTSNPGTAAVDGEDKDAGQTADAKDGVPWAQVDERVQDLIDRCADDMAERRFEAGLNQPGCHARREVLLRHMKDMFGSATLKGSDMKRRDWCKYCHIVYCGEVPALGDVQWPPSQETWTNFLMAAREQVSSYKRFSGWQGNVCEAACRYFGGGDGAKAVAMDPRQIYKPVHAKTMKLIRRAMGVGVRQVRGIDIQEARSGANFVDKQSVLGLSMAAAYNMGCVMGGRRPRALTSLQIRHLRIIAEPVDVQGQTVLVPAVTVTFPEEKFEDGQGPRSSRE